MFDFFSYTFSCFLLLLFFLFQITPLISISGKIWLPHIYNGTYFLSFYFQAQCSDPGSPVHGRRRGNIFRHNSWVQFLCDVHYMLHGEEWIQCIDGSWSALLPKCIGKPATLDGMFFHGPFSVFSNRLSFHNNRDEL